MAFTYPVLYPSSAANDKAAVKKLAKLLADADSDFDPSGKTFFDDEMREQVERYQLETGLVRDGVVGKCTWKALMGEDMDVGYWGSNINGQAQPDKETCWMAATATILQCSINQVSRGNAVIWNGGLENSDANLQLYAKEHGMRWERASFTVATLGSLLILKRLIMCNIDDDYEKYKAGNFTHWMVLFRMRTDGSPTGTTLTFWDPSPVQSGGRYAMSWGKFKQYYRSHMTKVT